VRKELDFARDFRINIIQKLSVAVATVVLALALRNYWALAFAQVIGAVVSCLISYLVHPYRPRFCLVKFKEYLRFSFSIVLINTGYFLRERIGAIAVGGGSGAAQLGAYNIANELATMAVRETAIPIWRGLFPAFAKIRDDRAQLLQAHERLLACIALVVLPLGFGTSVVAGELVAVLLGPAWGQSAELMTWLAIAATAIGLGQGLNGSILLVCGREKASLGLMWFEVGLLLPLALIASKWYGAQAVAMVSVFVLWLSVPVTTEVLRRTIGFRWSVFVHAVWRPACAAGAMMAVLHLLPMPSDALPIVSLALKVLAGGTTYVGALVALWVVSDRPDGPEQAIWRVVVERTAALRSLES
jgi:lipopolysaccharide exporter